MATVPRPSYPTVHIVPGAGGEGSGDPVAHSTTTGRSTADQHPIAAITNLSESLAGKLSTTGGGGDAVVGLGAMAGVVEVDLDGGNSFHGTLAGDVTDWTLVGAPTGVECEAVIEITQHASSAKTVAYPASWHWAGDGHVMSTAVGATDIIVVRTRDGGATVYAAIMGQAFA